MASCAKHIWLIKNDYLAEATALSALWTACMTGTYITSNSSISHCSSENLYETENHDEQTLETHLPIATAGDTRLTNPEEISLKVNEKCRCATYQQLIVTQPTSSACSYVPVQHTYAYLAWSLPSILFCAEKYYQAWLTARSFLHIISQDDINREDCLHGSEMISSIALPLPTGNIPSHLNRDPVRVRFDLAHALRKHLQPPSMSRGVLWWLLGWLAQVHSYHECLGSAFWLFSTYWQACHYWRNEHHQVDQADCST